MKNKFAIPLEPGKTYHILNHGIGNENLFRSDDNFQYFLNKYAHYIFPLANTYAYCLMPNHFHILLKIKEQLTLPDRWKKRNVPISVYVGRQFANFFNAYSKAYNKLYQRKGKLLQLPFSRILIDNKNFFTNTFHYIHLNPVHHDFTTKADEWIFSSIHAYTQEKSTKINVADGKHEMSEVPDWGQLSLADLDERYFLDLPY